MEKLKIESHKDKDKLAQAKKEVRAASRPCTALPHGAGPIHGTSGEKLGNTQVLAYRRPRQRR